MKFIVTFEDNDSMSHMRQEFMADHLSFLETNRDSIEAAGPLFRVENKEGAGGLWIVEADSGDAVHDLVKNDPFWPTGLRKSYTVLAWKQVFANGSRLVGPA